MSIFKAYDIRGPYEGAFNEAIVHAIGRWLPVVVPARRALIGRDARLSSPAIRDALCRGLAEAGCDVDDIGLASTPMVYFMTARGDYDLSVQITASHNPASHNGLKVSAREAVPVGYDTGLSELEQRIGGGNLPPVSSCPGRIASVSAVPAFVRFLSPWHGNRSGLAYAVDCSDGMAGLVARDLFPDARAVLNAVPDGRFPHHSPNPLEPASCEALAATVRDRGLDLGVIFDGDADRVMFIDEQGRFCRPDLLIAVIARHFLRQTPGATVLHDIRTSAGVIETLRKEGAKPCMWKVGHAFAKRKLRAIDGVCGGELAGHYYFRDFFWCDSGELAALIVLAEAAEAKRRGIAFSRLLAPIDRYANSGELNYLVAAKDDAIAAVRSAVRSEQAPTAEWDFDGYRIEFPDWWISLRKSNTEPYLRVILEARDERLLAQRRQSVESVLAPFLTVPVTPPG